MLILLVNDDDDHHDEKSGFLENMIIFGETKNSEKARAKPCSYLFSSATLFALCVVQSHFVIRSPFLVFCCVFKVLFFCGLDRYLKWKFFYFKGFEWRRKIKILFT